MNNKSAPSKLSPTGVACLVPSLRVVELPDDAPLERPLEEAPDEAEVGVAVGGEAPADKLLMMTVPFKPGSPVEPLRGGKVLLPCWSLLTVM